MPLPLPHKFRSRDGYLSTVQSRNGVSVNWCKSHWDQLRQAIKDRGLDGFGAQTGAEAAAEMRSQFAGNEEAFDPLIGSWSRINAYMSDSLTKQGRGAELLQLKCPCCILVEDGQPELVAGWINGCTDQAKVYAIEQGLLKAS